MTASPDNTPDSLVSARKFLADTPRERLLGYLDIAKRDVPDAAISLAMTEISTAMMDRTMTPQEAGIALLYAANPGKKSLVIRDIACQLAAAERIQASVDADKGDEPTQDAPAADPAKAKKPKRAKNGKNLKADTTWIKKIGTNGGRWNVEPVNETALWAADRYAEIVSGYRAQPHVRDVPVYQFGRLPGLDEGSVTGYNVGPVLDGKDDGPLVVLALVEHSKKGFPKNAIRERAIREHATGPIPMSAAEMEQHLTDEWYAHAVTEVVYHPIVWAPKLGEILVSATGKAAQGFVSCSQAVPVWKQVQATPVPVPELPTTDLVHVGANPDDDKPTLLNAFAFGCDARLWFLWLCQVRGNGTWWEQTGTIREEGWNVWIDDEAEITIKKTGQERKIVTVKNAAADHGALIAALAEGGVITKLRIGLQSTLFGGDGTDKSTKNRRPKKYYHLTLSSSIWGGTKKSIGLPCTMKARDGVMAAVLERLTLLRELDKVEARLTSRFEECRVGEWDRVVSRLREWIGIEVVRRWKYDPKSGQGFLFDHGAN